ncbi:hypothetical protein PPYR_08512 [Photinus pyralis]|uniref:tRNA-uridine aminocarboxypropyltransferase 1 n=1 Tax=Photinus pyralis TaxID=7054 RepID=A0A5N4AJN2_PHOPY|nr:DTW domain-containing protein 1 [Photinus pyralis]KAB0797519.1 hypothetical protein PPYR_08512 [Photinus pyralis]
MPNGTDEIDKTPFEGMLINDDAFLNQLEGRYPCPKCSKSRKYFCYTCYVPVSELDGKLPFVKLPLKIDIIKHRNEIDGKSTAAHAAVLAHEDVSVYTYPNIPDYDHDTVLIYPSFEALTINQLFDEHSKRGILNMLPKGHNKTTLMTAKSRDDSIEDYIDVKHNGNSILPVKKAVFIDSTWNQSKGIYKDTRINSLRCVVLQQRISQFWRHHKGSPRWYLSTIEAVHQFLIEIHLNMWGLNSEYDGLKNCFSDRKVNNLVLNNSNSYDGQYDNLLFFFRHMYKLIHTYYDHQTLYAYKRRLL